MSSEWATENLQVIRTLMERSAIYRRALGPVMLGIGLVGSASSLLGKWLFNESLAQVILYWLVVSGVCGLFAWLWIRQQALKEGEPFWTPPARRVALALLPPLTSGLCLALLAFHPRAQLLQPWLPVLWLLLYGSAAHSAGFFAPQGIRRFGWILVVSGSILGYLIANESIDMKNPIRFHECMGLAFGGLHLFYGFYLLLTTSSKTTR